MTLATLNLALAAYMAGVIWVVQVVHYPLMAQVPEPQWPAYEAAHRTRITVVVLVPMVAQLVVGALLVADPPKDETGLAVVSLALAATNFAATAAIFGPLHERMSQRHDPALVQRLVTLNWGRTAAWTAQTVTAVLLVT